VGCFHVLLSRTLGLRTKKTFKNLTPPKTLKPKKPKTYFF